MSVMARVTGSHQYKTVYGKTNSNIVYENLPKCTFQMSRNGKDLLVPLVVESENEVMALIYSILNSNNNIDIGILLLEYCCFVHVLQWRLHNGATPIEFKL